MNISQRGQSAVTKPLRVDFELFFEASEDLFHPVENPEGKFTLNIAENKLMWPVLSDRLVKVSQEHIPDWVSSYTSTLGGPEFREVMAEFYGKYVAGCRMDPNKMAFSSGATSVIEMSALCLTDSGDTVAFPAPCYPVYSQDIGNKAGAKRYDINANLQFSELLENEIVDVSNLIDAKEEIESSGSNLRMLVITNPDNPTGRIMPLDKLKEIADWCISNKVHLVVNEIYALSLVNTYDGDISGDYAEDKRFTSIVSFIEERQSDFLHIWYSFSKDFGISGFRVGFTYSCNKEYIQAYQNLNAPNMVSNHTQWILMQVFKDKKFLEGYIERNKELLTRSYKVVRDTMEECSIPFVPSRGSLFVWIDLSKYMAENTSEEEEKLWKDVYEETGVLLTPGNGFGNTSKGGFRIVYTCLSYEDLKVSMGRLKKYFIQKNKL